MNAARLPETQSASDFGDVVRGRQQERQEQIALGEDLSRTHRKVGSARGNGLPVQEKRPRRSW